MQRYIVVDPAAYAHGIGVAPEEMSPDQLREYWNLAVHDDFAFAKQLAAGFEKDKASKFLAQTFRAFSDTQDMGKKIGLLDKLIGGINQIQDHAYGLYQKDENPGGPAQPNRQTRYATVPNDAVGGTGKFSQYQHTSLQTGEPEGVKWGDDDTMGKRFARDFGPALLTGSLGATKPRGHDFLPIHQIPWELAKKILPRPMLNLLFDVRFQLETNPSRVVDERTRDEQNRKDKSPHAPGTLRSWHQDSAGVLPANNLEKGVPEKSVALHKHYSANSQTGAGSSIGMGVDGPVGFAEYTGTGSNSEHNTKVVLDYTTGRTYLTLTHYQYWALIAKPGDYEFWQSGTQELGQAQGRLQTYGPKGKVFFMSPWLEIQMPALDVQPFDIPQEWDEPDFFEQFAEQVAFEQLQQDPGVGKVATAFTVERVSGDQMNCFLRCVTRAFGNESAQRVGDLRELLVQKVDGIQPGAMIDVATPQGQRALEVLAGQGYNNCTIHVVQVAMGTGNITTIDSFTLGNGAIPVYILHTGAHFSYLAPRVLNPLQAQVFENVPTVDHSAEEVLDDSHDDAQLSDEATHQTQNLEQVSKIRNRFTGQQGSLSRARSRLDDLPRRELETKTGRSKSSVVTRALGRFNELPGWGQAVFSFGTVVAIFLVLAYFFSWPG